MSRRNQLPVLVVAAALLWLSLSAAAASAATLAGSVVGLGGQVYVERGGQRYSLQIGEAVYTDDTVEVAAGAKLKLRMSDGSILSMAAGSVMRIDAYVVDASGRRRSATLSLGQGLLRSETAPGGGPAPFEISTATGVSGARSTDWFVNAGAGYHQVAVLVGSVRLSSRATGRSVVVPAGSGSRVATGGDPSPPEPLSQAEFVGLIGATEGAGAPAPPQPSQPPPYSPAPPSGGYFNLPGAIPLPQFPGGMPGNLPRGR